MTQSNFGRGQSDALYHLPSSRTDERMLGEPILANIVDVQHPDRETPNWPAATVSSRNHETKPK